MRISESLSRGGGRQLLTDTLWDMSDMVRLVKASEFQKAAWMIHITASEWLLVSAFFVLQVILAWRTGRFWMRGNLTQYFSRDVNPARFQLMQGLLIVSAIVSAAMGVAQLLELIGPDLKL
jgi:hypothetical protein